MFGEAAPQPIEGCARGDDALNRANSLMARAFRRHLAEHGVRPDADLKVLRDAIAHIEERKAAAMAA
ncbi:MAG: hypothetical protein ACM3OF_12035 [Gemmatimonas sp.]